MKSQNKLVTFNKAEDLFKLKPSTMVRLIVEGVAFRAKVKDLDLGFTDQARAVQCAQNSLARHMGLGECCNGLSGSWHGVSVQIDVVNA